MINIKNLQVQKSGKTICNVPELHIKPGERVAVIGPNGCGKTTLLRVLAGLETEFSGQCEIDVPAARRTYVHQRPYLFKGTVLYNVTYSMVTRNIPNRDRLFIARQSLDVFEVSHLERRQCHTLSGGERRRVALARAATVAPELLILDEPLADLDEEGIGLVGRAFFSGESPGTIVIASPVPVPDGFDGRSFQM